MLNKQKVHEIIVNMVDKKRKDEYEKNPSFFSSIHEVPNLPLNTRELLEQLDSNITTHEYYFSILDELELDGKIIDLSSGNWGVSKEVINIGEWVQLID
ncbi:hypothetical protein [Vibrio diazotrophicus]|uniref:hypothetical protein n=1 Tax=Vibrio diazotrophicus TaxID=685 RepID=UPI000C9DD32B|nr:hypothetical protein [Vibrio diazotrophicus]PNH79472.1 hypothetical protein C1N27_13755 [Vibrio diazotrophicus]